MLFGVSHRFFKQRDVQPSFCIPARRFREGLKKRCNMQQTSAIQAQEAQRTGAELAFADVKSTVIKHLAAINAWLDSKNAFYSRIAEFGVTNRTVVRINAVTACVIIGALVIEAAPVASLLSAACAAWMVRRLNKSERKNESAEKGGTL